MEQLKRLDKVIRRLVDVIGLLLVLCALLFAWRAI